MYLFTAFKCQHEAEP